MTHDNPLETATVQVESILRGGHLPEREDNGVHYLKLPNDQL